jgi:hypothetical protein
MRIFIFLLSIVLTFSACFQSSNEPKSEDTNKIKENRSEFEFGGNYLPTKEFKIKNHLLNSIEISTNDSLVGNKIELIYIRFTDLKTDEYYVVMKTIFTGTKENFSVSANDPVLGKIEIKGKFSGIKGPMNDNIEDPNTIVFKGTISANGINNEKLECTYFEGD